MSYIISGYLSQALWIAPGLANTSDVDQTSPSEDTLEDETISSETAAVEPEPEASETDDVDNLVIVGSRRAVRSVLDSPTPVDSIKTSDMNQQGATDIEDMLRTLVPSYNVNTQPISDAATIIRPANLRGLPPDNTVVLVNGKRRHRGAVITFLGGGLSDGAHGADLAPIPTLALKRVDILRDGAAAQYGSDAIAGVMNFVLRDDPYGVEFQTKVGSYLTEGVDEYAWTMAINAGFPLTDSGFFNVTAEYGHTQPTDRSVQRADAAQLAAIGEPVRNPAHIWGSPKISGDLKTFVNMGIDFSDDVTMYAFGNFARRDVLGGFFYRNPRTRGGVYRGDREIEVNGEKVTEYRIQVADLTPDGTGACPDSPRYNGGPDGDLRIIDQAAYDEIFAREECFVWNEVFPGGFTPQFGGEVTDLSLSGGLRGTLGSGLRWDVSASVGSSRIQFLIKNTINASLGPSSPRSFNPGSYREIDQTYNVDLSYPLALDFLASDLTISTGFEYRKEVFVVSAGDPASYAAGPLADQGFGVGSNGFPGFSPNIAGTFSRENIGAYLEVAADIIDPLTVQLAARVEDYDSFGTQGTVKATTRLNLLPSSASGGLLSTLALRGSIGTGYRAPSAGQANVSNISTVSGENGLEDRGTIPPTNPVAQLRGGKPLEPETSLNISGGLVLQLGKHLELTSDYYYIEVKDRISQSGDQSLTAEERQALRDSGVVGAGDLATFRFFTNAFDTTTQGVDVVASTRFPLANAGMLAMTLAYNWNSTTVDDYIGTVITEARIKQIEDTLPKHRGVATLSYLFDPVRVTVRGNYFGPYLSYRDDADNFFSDQVLWDLEVGVNVLDQVTVMVGGQNILDTRPQENTPANQRSLGARYPRDAPTGINGGFYYARAQVTF